MSRYMLNKVLLAIDRADEALAAFKADPGRYLADWEDSANRPLPPCPDGGRLTSDEREALSDLDFGWLYAAGANPFLLWQFARSVTVPDLMTIEELIAEFREAVEPHGRPDYST